MQYMINSLNVLLPLLYGSVFTLYILFFFQKSDLLKKYASLGLLFTIVVHILYLAFQGIQYNQFPISTVFSSLSMLGLDIALIYYIIEKRLKEGRTGIFFLGIVFLLQLIASMFNTGIPEPNEILSNPMFGIHTTSTIFGISALAIAALYSLMYLMLAKDIKKHRFGVIYNGLPSLEIMETMARVATGFGLILLGIGIFLGHLWAYKVIGYFIWPDPKIIISDIAWFAYLIGWIFVHFRKVRGIRMSFISVIGFLIFFITLTMANFLQTTFHNFV